LRVFGGYDTVEGDRNDVWVFSRAGGEWRQVVAAPADAVPAIRSGHSAVVGRADEGRTGSSSLFLCFLLLLSPTGKLAGKETSSGV
jgi:hypothetical protein